MSTNGQTRESAAPTSTGCFPTFGRLLRWRRWRIGACVVLALLLVGGVVDGIATAYYGGKVESQLAALEAAGKPLSFRDLAPARARAGGNAAPLLLAAAEIVHHHDPPGQGARSESWGHPMPAEARGYGEFDWGEPADLARLARYVREDRRALDLLREAEAKAGVDFGVNWENPMQALFPYYQKLRSLARFLGDAAVLASHEGNQAEALERLRLGYSLTRASSQDPTLIGQLVACATDAMATVAAQRVVLRGPIPEAEARRLSAELDRIDYRQTFTRASGGERACGIWLFGAVRRGNVRMTELLGDQSLSLRRRLLLWAYPKVLRPVLYADELRYLSYMARVEQRAALSPQERAHSDQPKLEMPGSIAPGWAVIASILVPVFEKASTKAESTQAQRRLLQAALGVLLYRQAHGRYPASLAKVRAMGWPVPLDNYSDRDLVYRLKGDSYVLYSIGPDLKDDGGRPLWWQHDLGGKAFGRRADSAEDLGDIVWIHGNEPRSGAPHR